MVLEKECAPQAVAEFWLTAEGRGAKMLRSDLWDSRNKARYADYDCLATAELTVCKQQGRGA